MTLTSLLTMAFCLSLPQLSMRGTEVALFDYMDFGEKLLDLRVLILFDAHHHWNFPGTIDKFTSRFGAENVLGVDHWAQVDPILTERGATHLVVIKFGPPDGHLSRLPGVRNCVLANFDARQPHGHVFARVSAAIPGNAPVVPHIVRSPPSLPADGDQPADMRGVLGIPHAATVFGRHGGFDQFNIDFVLSTVVTVAAEHPQIYFLFMNTKPWTGCEERSNIIFLPPTSDALLKSRFIRSCDAMLHARGRGETFGLAVAEFSVHNRPVLTSSEHHENHRERAHLDILGSKGLYYHDEPSLRNMLTTFDATRARGGNWNAYESFTPDLVMKRFRDVFILEEEGTTAVEVDAINGRQRGAGDHDSESDIQQQIQSVSAQAQRLWFRISAATEAKDRSTLTHSLQELISLRERVGAVVNK